MHNILNLSDRLPPAHKDPYENVYVVVRGHKDFTLFPPTDLPWMCYRDYPTGVFERNEGGESGFRVRRAPGTS